MAMLTLLRGRCEELERARDHEQSSLFPPLPSPWLVILQGDFLGTHLWQRGNGVVAYFWETLCSCARSITLRNHSKQFRIVTFSLEHFSAIICSTCATGRPVLRILGTHFDTFRAIDTPPEGFGRNPTKTLADKKAGPKAADTSVSAQLRRNST